MNIALSPHGLSSSLRCAAVALAAGAAVLVGGCGSAGVEHHRNASQSTFAANHTVQQVEQHFQAATGQALSDSSSAVWDTLSLPAGNTQDYNRFGTFTIDVLRNADELSVFTTQNGRHLTPDAQGVYWPLTADANGYWDPAKVYGNVVLTWSTQSHTTNGQFTLLNAILSTLGQGASAVTAKLPASDLSCQMEDMNANGQREGTCDDNGVTRTVVNRNHTLHAPGMDVQVTRTKLGRVIKSPYPFEPPTYAKGEFVAVGLNLTNTGSSPLEGDDESELEIDGKYYSQDFNGTFDLNSADAFPLQPGDSATTVLAFDVPLNVAVDALTQGEIVVPDSSDDTVDFSTHLYAIRLAEPTAEGGRGTATSPAPAPTLAPAARSASGLAPTGRARVIRLLAPAGGGGSV